MLKVHFIGRSMRLEFKHPQYQTPIITSTIVEIKESACPELSVSSVDVPAAAN